MSLVEKCPKCGTLLPLKSQGEARRCYFCGLALTQKPHVVEAPGGPQSVMGSAPSAKSAQQQTRPAQQQMRPAAVSGRAVGGGGTGAGAVVAGLVLLVAIGGATFFLVAKGDSGGRAAPAPAPSVATESAEPVPMVAVPEVAPEAAVEPAPGSPGEDHLSPSEVGSVVRKGQGALARCFDKQLKTNPDFAPGQLEARLTIGENGTVTKVDVDPTDNKAFDTCVRRAVRAWRFRATSSTTRISIPLRFK